MKKLSLTINLVLCALIFFSVITGCVSDGRSSGAAADETDNITQESEVSQLQPVELVYLHHGTEGKDLELVDSKISEYIQPLINATFKRIMVNNANLIQQVNLMSASGEPLDLVLTSSFYGYANSVVKGQVIPLDALLDEYGSNIKSVLGDEYLEATKVNDEIYAVPSIHDMAADFGVMMRGDLVDKYGIDLSQIKTLEDLEPKLFKIIKENEPDLITTAGFPGTNTIVGLLFKGIFDPLDDRFGVLRVKDDNLKIINLYETEEYAQSCNFARSLFNAGYISKDEATSTENRMSMVAADRLFSFFYSFKPGIEGQETLTTGKPMVALPLTDVICTTSNVTAMMTSISKNSQDPERAMMLLDLWFKDANLVNLFNNGVEGVNYVKSDDGFIAYPESVNASNTGYTSYNFIIGNNYLSDIWQGYPADLYDQLKTFNDTATRSKGYGFSFNQESVKAEAAAANAVMDEYRAGLESGTLDPAATIPELNSRLKDTGIDIIIAEKQRQIDEWAAANNIK
jgi:putative aldouronate transport system substrate-binding protein